MKRSTLAIAFTAALAYVSIQQAFLYSKARKFIVQTARLAQTPAGKQQHDAHGPVALLDGNAGNTSFMHYPLGPSQQNYFWLELGVSHFPEIRAERKESSMPVRIQTSDHTQKRDHKNDIVFSPRVPDRIRVWNGPCTRDLIRLDDSNPKGSSGQRETSANGTRIVQLKKARLDFYYRPLNDPDQDFGYPEATPVASYEIDIPSRADSFDFPLELPAPNPSPAFPEKMHMILLKLTVLEVRPSHLDVAQLKPEIQSVLRSRPEGPILTLCEIQYADRPSRVDESEDFFVFW